MKIKAFVFFYVTTLLTEFSSVYSQTRCSSFGSNPEFSWELFPQDVSLQHSNALIFYPSYCKSPWWGDIDEANNKPSGATYTITGSEISEGEAFFIESAKLHTSKNIFGYSYRPSDKLTTKFDFNYTIDAMRDKADGNFTNNLDSTYIPFDYSLRHTVNRMYLSSLFGFSFHSIPVGLNVKLGFENTLALNHHFTFTKSDTINISTERALWGWSTVGCNHIFGVRGTEGDAWFQNSYSRGPLYTFDITGGTSLSKIKTGFSLHFTAGSQDYFSWQQDTTISTSDTILDRNFVGNYVKSDWTKKSHLGEMNVYGNFHWLNGDMFGLHTFFLAGYSGSVAGNVLTENLDIASDSKESNRGIVLEADPNINIKLGPALHYIDIGLILNYRFNRANNTFLRWVGGGQIKTYWDSEIYDLDETSWESFSYANINTFNAGLDLSAMFPLMNNNYGNLGFGLTLFGNIKQTFQTKYYGTNSDNGARNTFTLNNERVNHIKEGILNTILMLNYIRNRFTVRIEVTEPILHSLTTSTRIKNADGANTGPYHKKDPLWLSAKGLQVGAFISYDFRFSFLKYDEN